jgi:hypothetical protein
MPVRAHQHEFVPVILLRLGCFHVQDLQRNFSFGSRIADSGDARVWVEANEGVVRNDLFRREDVAALAGADGADGRTN